MKTLPRDKARLVEELVRRHQTSVRGWLRVVGCPPHLLDDLVQDAFLVVLSDRFEHRSDAQTAAFLRTVTRNLMLKALERERRLPEVHDVAAAEEAWAGFEAEDGGEGWLAALRDCLEGVRGRARDVIELRYGSRLERTEIGARVGMSEAGVKSILVRTKKQLRECIERRRSA